MRRLRWAVGGAAALLILGPAAAVGVGWYFSGVAIALGSGVDLVATVLQVGPDDAVVRLSGTTETRRPGVLGLEWPGGYGRLGAVSASTPTSVTRAFTPLIGRPSVGLAVGVDPGEYPGDPRTAVGLDFRDLPLPSDVGVMPTWYVPGAHGDGLWAVFVHGHDSSRRESLRYLQTLHRLGMPVLVPSYRGDVGATPNPDGHQDLGATEWRDLEPSVRFALDHGARGVILFGWSMGGAVSLQFTDRSALRGAVRGLVLDSPVLDWRDVLTHQGRLRGLPDAESAVAEWIVGLRLGTSLDRFDWVTRAGDLHLPMFIVSSDADGYVPDGPAHALARARPDLVTSLDVPGAGHTLGWNTDPDRYRAALTGWLKRQGV